MYSKPNFSSVLNFAQMLKRNNRNFSLIRVLDLSVNSDLPLYFKDPCVKLLTSRKLNLTSLDLSQCKYISDTAMIDILTKTSHSLVNLSLAYCRRTTDLVISVLAAFVKPYHRMRSLSIGKD